LFLVFVFVFVFFFLLVIVFIQRSPSGWNGKISPPPLLLIAVFNVQPPPDPFFVFFFFVFFTIDSRSPCFGNAGYIRRSDNELAHVPLYIACRNVTDALQVACDVQRALCSVAWPEELLKHPLAAVELPDGKCEEREKKQEKKKKGRKKEKQARGGGGLPAGFITHHTHPPTRQIVPLLFFDRR
jgi:hypothetical protein